MNEPMKVLLIEDDEKICKEFENVIKERNDIVLSKRTNSSKIAINLIKTYKYDAIILDLELHYGSGSGFEFLTEFQTLNINPKPIIIVNTNIISEVIYDNLHDRLVDMIFFKRQEDYSVEKVVDTLISLGKHKERVSNVVDNPEDKEKMILNLINKELDLVGISHKLKGRKYCVEAIICMMDENNRNNPNFSVFQYIGKEYKVEANSINKGIQTAINEAWRTTAIEDLREYYTAKININSGVPTPTEFICYYADKIKQLIENN